MENKIKLIDIEMKLKNTNDPMAYVPYENVKWLIKRIKILESRNKRVSDAAIKSEQENNDYCNILERIETLGLQAINAGETLEPNKIVDIIREED